MKSYNFWFQLKDLGVYYINKVSYLKGLLILKSFQCYSYGVAAVISFMIIFPHDKLANNRWYISKVVPGLFSN